MLEKKGVTILLLLQFRHKDGGRKLPNVEFSLGKTIVPFPGIGKIVADFEVWLPSMPSLMRGFCLAV
ncbi:MAG: hypothetical protein O7B35_07605 [Deltaproteobacteria bacterium]|nr:hypothetical protein [Deltaproteobacteria bacterium]